MSGPAEQADRESVAGVWWLIGGVVVLMLLGSTCESKVDSTETLNSSSAASETLEEVPSAPIPPPVVDELSVRRAAAHVRLALDSEGFPGAMIYSQNCFASVERKFSWTKLDQCGAFDSLVELGASGEGLIGAEGNYFAKTAMQERLVAAAEKSGASSESLAPHFEQVAAAAMARIADLQVEPEAVETDDAFNANDAVVVDSDNDGSAETANADPVNVLESLAPRED